MAFYESNLVILVIVNAFLLYKQRQQHKAPSTLIETKDQLEAENEKIGDGRVTKFKRQFYPAYILVVGADWLQVSYLPLPNQTP